MLLTVRAGDKLQFTYERGGEIKTTSEVTVSTSNLVAVE